MELVTGRLLLREYRNDDAPAFVAYQQDPRAREFYGPDEGDDASLHALVPLFVRWSTETPRTNWQLAIATREAPDVTIGSVALRTAGQPAGTAQFGLELAPSMWGVGYGSEAARAMLGAGFGELALDTVLGETVSANARIARVLRALAFRHVGDRDGPAWMQERGWHETLWELTRAAYRAARVGDGS